jgi:hypothetical protein
MTVYSVFHVVDAKLRNNSLTLDDGAHHGSVQAKEQATLHMQRRQSHVQRVLDLGDHWSATDVPVRAGV